MRFVLVIRKNSIVTANCIVLHVWLIYFHTPVLVWIIA
nr:unnamed protein product [Callosobruchus analis]